MFETFLFALTLVKFFQSAMAMYRRESLLYIFVRDGTWAFAVIFGESFKCEYHTQYELYLMCGHSGVASEHVDISAVPYTCCWDGILVSIFT